MTYATRSELRSYTLERGPGRCRRTNGDGEPSGLKCSDVFNHFVKVLVASSFALAGLAITSGRAGAATTVPPATSLGYDVSFPQCGGNLPTPVGFGIVGVNDGHPFSTNPCLVPELRWAAATLSASPEFYTNTANPGPAGDVNWPTSQQSPEVCSGANTVACSYDFGWNAAQGSFQDATAAEASIGTPTPLLAATQATWWLDVESGNAWQSIRTGAAPTSAAFANDDAVIAGELTYFASVDVTSVGIYSTTSQWRGLMGNTGTTFAATKVWLPGYADLTQAQAACGSTSFTGGRVAMIQYPSIGLDGDYLCPLVVGPLASAASVAASATFSDQLSLAGQSQAATFLESTGAPDLSVSSTGLITTSGQLPAGTYTTTGTTFAAGDSGPFSFTLVVGALTQSLPTTAAASVTAAVNFHDQLVSTGSSVPVTYTKTSGASGLLVSPTGLLSTDGTLTRGLYVARGATTDASGDRGTFIFFLRVGALVQRSLMKVSTTAPMSAVFKEQLSVTGGSGPVTYTQVLGPPNLLVSPTGLLTTDGALVAGTYPARGTTSDASGDRGTFFVDLTVTPAGRIIENVPVRASVGTISSGTFNDQITVTNAVGSVTYTQNAGAPNLLVSPTGLVSTSGVLTPGSYVARGTTSDANSNRGTFFFNLVVRAPGTLTQSSPTSASSTTSASFSDQLTVMGGSVPVTFTQSSGTPDLIVSAGGLVTTSGALPAGSYVTRGTTSDVGGDQGTFFFVLVVPVSAPPAPVLEARRVLGEAAAGRTVVLHVLGTGFEGRPMVTSHAGTTALVVADSGTTLTLRVSVRPGSRSGTFTFTITLANGKKCTVRYIQR